jgi:hypothetical protein
MADLHACDVSFKTVAGFLQKVRGHAQVDLSCPDMDMAKINGQQGEQALHIRALAVPGDEPVNRKAVPEIVYPWLMARAICAAKTDPVAQCSVVVLERVRFDAPAASRRKERNPVARSRMAALMLKQDPLKLRRKWHQARRVSMTLRHSGMEFSEFNYPSFGVC